MQPAARRLVACVVATTVGLALSVGQVSAADASTAAATAPLSNQYCAAFVDYFTVSLVAEFAAALAKSFENLGTSNSKKKPPSPDEIRSLFLLVFSPKLERATGVMAKGGESVLRPVWRRQQTVFADGSSLLESAGLTRRQIEVLAKADVDASNASIENATGKVKLNQKKLTALAKQFQHELDRLKTPSDTRARTAYQRAGSECGAFPDATIDCAKLLPEPDAVSILGGPVSKDSKNCAYTAAQSASGEAPKVGLEVYSSTRAFDTLSRSAKGGTAVAGIGDRALAHDGYGAFLTASTCGRTLIVAKGQHTIAVALCLANDAPVSNDVLAQIAGAVLSRLG